MRDWVRVRWLWRRSCKSEPLVLGSGASWDRVVSCLTSAALRETLLWDGFCHRANANEALDRGGSVNINSGSVPAKSISTTACFLPPPPLAGF